MNSERDSVKEDLETYKEEYGLNWRGFARQVRDLLEEQGRLDT